MNRQAIAKHNKNGLVPGPSESKTDFMRRVDYCLHINEILLDKSAPRHPFSSEIGKNEPSHIEEGTQVVKTLYDIEPLWVPIFYTNYQLLPWHGGCAWIFQLEADSPTSSLIQMGKSWKTRPSSLLYSREELLAHELCHTGRMMFQEPKYEEIIAYQTSTSPFRRFFGPIATHSIETMLFLISLLLIFLIDLVIITAGAYSLYHPFMTLKLIPLGMAAFALCRLWKRQRTFQKARRNLAFTSHPDAVLFRLTDREIDSFAHMSETEIRSYANENTTLRWEAIQHCYFE